mmetsp:Transcript_30055/g.76547  ORF Transcript_30055/g.76547 Transcript_30055/m.76547 type:complete len:104 (-) Transcript_30055:281-592(-)
MWVNPSLSGRLQMCCALAGGVWAVCIRVGALARCAHACWQARHPSCAHTRTARCSHRSHARASNAHMTTTCCMSCAPAVASAPASRFVCSQEGCSSNGGEDGG